MLDALDNREREVVRRALVAAADGPYFPDWEFQTLFGVERVQVRETAAASPALSAANQVHFLSVNNSLQWLVAYPHNFDAEMVNSGMDKADLVAILRKIRDSLGKPANERMDFCE